MRHHRSFFTLFLPLAFLAVPTLATDARAQQSPGQGMMLVTDWPDDETKRSGRFDILPFIDTLSIAYQYRVVEDRPELSIVLEWIPGAEAIVDGERISLTQVDGVPAIVGLELSADVVSNGANAATFSLIVDSMVVEAHPDIIRIDLPLLDWDNVFVDTPANVAREVFESGFELRRPTIVGAAFALFEEGRRTADTAVQKRSRERERRPPKVRPRRPRNVSIYRHPSHVDVVLDVFWLIGSRYRGVRIADDGPRDNIGRGSLGGSRRSRSGRGEADVDRSRGGSASAGSAGDGDQTDRGRRTDDRSGGSDDADGQATESSREGRTRAALPSRSKKDSEDDDDDDDDSKLVPYAVAAVAAAGVLAAVGGTIGYYGNARHAPLGVTSGIVRNDGGVLLQVAVNEALIAGEGGPQRLAARILGFGNLFGTAALQPAFGAGVLATSRGGEVKYEPGASLGGVLRHNSLLFYAGYDVMQDSPEFSLAIDLRRIGQWRKKGD